ncbi:MAG: glutathione S-transferase family protein [Hyphomonadaceae bacterium]|nr:glutathione S-transferase family protein [Hyphomonadaceae bacterium]
MIRLHYDPASTTCRSILLYAAEAGLPLDMVVVDLFSDEHRGEAFTRLNPSQAVPVLEHDGFVLTESSAILKYLADLVSSPAYPKDLKARARVNEMMDWFNTGLMRDLCYGLVYARVLSHYRLPEPGFTQALRIHEPRVAKRLRALDTIIGAKPFVCGQDITIADYLGSAFVTSGELIGFDLRPWPNVSRWIANMKALPAWDEVNAAFYGWRSAVEAQAKLKA